MKKRIKTAGALTLAAITVLSAAGLSSVYGALGVETGKQVLSYIYIGRHGVR